MTRIAAIDCGTNSIRLLVAEQRSDGLVDVTREMRVVRLGQDVDRTGRLAPEAIERTMTALSDYAETIAALAVDRVRMVATSATRDAANSADFVAAVTAVLGAPPDVISGSEEAALSFAGATSGLDGGGSGPVLVVDIGGGSTEFVLGTSHPTASLSVDIGCVRLTERRLAADPPTALQVAEATADVEAALDDVAAAIPVASASTLIGVAGSVTTVAAIALGLAEYDPERIHHSRISRGVVRELTERLLAMPRAERAAIPAMHLGRVDVIGAGALVLATLMQRFGFDDVLVSEHDILDGIALSLL